MSDWEITNWLLRYSCLQCCLSISHD